MDFQVHKMTITLLTCYGFHTNQKGEICSKIQKVISLHVR